MIGKTVSHYRIEEKIGAGGMGEVFLAEDTKLDRKVALKFLPSSLWNEAEAQQRLIREAKAASKLDHPNIVTIHGVEEHEGRPFIIMAHVPGVTLKQYCTTTPRSTDELIDLAIQIADGLQHAHEAGVVHRDLKPSNVLVSEQGRARILDFGIARLRGAAKLTQTGSTVGTIAYAPPELAQGKEATPASDVYSLGVVMYQMLSGRLPFEADHEAALLYSILHEAPTPLAECNPKVTPELQAIVAKCLEKEPEQRFASCAELVTELGRLRAPKSAGAAAGGNDKPSIAVLPFTNLSADPENEYFSDGLTEELLNVLARNPRLKVTGRTSSFVFKDKREDLREIGHKLGVETLLEGSVRKAGNRVRITAQLVKASDGFHLWSQTFDRVLDDIFAVQDEIAGSVSSALNVTLLGPSVPAHKTTGETYNLLLQASHFATRNSREDLERAVRLFEEVLELDSENARARAGWAFGMAHRAAQGFIDQDEALPKILASAEEALKLDDAEPRAHHAMGWIRFLFQHDWHAARRHLERAVELAPNDPAGLLALGKLEYCEGHLDRAMELAKQCVGIDPLNALAHREFGRLRRAFGEHQAAIRSYRKSLELSPGMVVAHANIGLSYMDLGEYERAIEEAQKEESAGYRYWALGIIYQAASRNADSARVLEQLKTGPECGPQWAIQIANVHACRGEVDEAFHWIERAFEIGDTGLVLLKPAPYMDNLRSDPRYSEVLKRVGLTP